MKKLFYAIAALIAAGFVSTAATRSPKSAVARNIDVFNSVMKELQTNYVDSIDVEASVRTAIDAMLETLDPYTEYIRATNAMTSTARTTANTPASEP